MSARTSDSKQDWLLGVVLGTVLSSSYFLYYRYRTRGSRRKIIRTFDEEGRPEWVKYPVSPQAALPHLVQSFSSPNQIAATQNLVVCMVALPGRGKTSISRRTARFLHFFHGAVVAQFNVSEYRRKHLKRLPDASLFDPETPGSVQELMTYNEMAMRDLKLFLSEGLHERRVAFYDAPNVSRERRRWILKQLRPLDVKTVFVEILDKDEDVAIVPEYMSESEYKLHGTNRRPEEDIRMFREIIAMYAKSYETLDAEGEDAHHHFIKLTHRFQHIEVSNIQGWLQGRIVQFLMNCHLEKRPIYLTRHGQSEFNVLGRIGGDSNLTEMGEAYARKLGEFAATSICRDSSGKPVPARLWTSTLKRTKATVRHIPHPAITLPSGETWVQMAPRAWTNLDEIYAGACDTLTYKDIQQRFPEEARARKLDKLAYRYPHGESYLDVIQRLEPCIHEICRSTEPVLICSHQGVLRMIYAFYMGHSRDEAPRLEIKLNHVYKLTQSAYGCKVDVFELIPNGGESDGQEHM